jgi:hypothetical protein
MESRTILVGPEHEARARAIATFYRHGMPGMTLLARGIAAPPPVVLKPLPQPYGICHYKLESGDECGRHISRNKTRCGSCYHSALKVVAESLTPEQLAEFLKDMDGLDRLEVLSTIRPYLKFSAA